jgi:hypothetical protein
VIDTPQLPPITGTPPVIDTPSLPPIGGTPPDAGQATGAAAPTTSTEPAPVAQPRVASSGIAALWEATRASSAAAAAVTPGARRAVVPGPLPSSPDTPSPAWPGVGGTGTASGLLLAFGLAILAAGITMAAAAALRRAPPMPVLIRPAVILGSIERPG